jgi:hypothetical protein
MMVRRWRLIGYFPIPYNPSTFWQLPLRRRARGEREASDVPVEAVGLMFLVAEQLHRLEVDERVDGAEVAFVLALVHLWV